MQLGWNMPVERKREKAYQKYYRNTPVFLISYHKARAKEIRIQKKPWKIIAIDIR